MMMKGRDERPFSYCMQTRIDENEKEKEKEKRYVYH